MVSRKILIVEDEPDVCASLQSFLGRRGFSVSTTASGSDALRIIPVFLPDLILLDLDLPDIHGSEVLKQLQENNRTKDIPVVILSAAAMPKQIKEMQKAGAKNYLTKPLDLITFLNEIDKWVKS